MQHYCALDATHAGKPTPFVPALAIIVARE
jgi:hypothetical protein